MSTSESSDAAYINKSATEIIEIVDIDNNVLEPSTRSVMRANGLIHRATYALVRTSGNYFYVQKRSMLKDYCPGLFDPTPGGVVAAGESYEATNTREVEEEMGIVGVDMKHCFTFFYEDSITRCWGDLWECVYDGPIKMQKEEVDDVVMMSMDEIISQATADSTRGNFTADSIFACQRYVELNGCPPAVGERPEVEFL